jgi:hypothetical protein
VTDFFKKQAIRSGVSYISRTALCYIAKKYGGSVNVFGFKLTLPLMPFIIPEYLKNTNWEIFWAKAWVTGTVAVTLPGMLGLFGPVTIITRIIYGGFAFYGVFVGRNTQKLESGIMKIPTEPVLVTADKIRRRIPDQPDVVVVDLQPSRPSRIEMPSFSTEKGKQCRLFNQNSLQSPQCKWDTSEIGKIDLEALPFSVKDVVTMKDVLKLEDQKMTFCDIAEIVPIRSATIEGRPQLRGTKRRMENFLKKFGDPKTIPESEKWDVCRPFGSCPAEKIPISEIFDEL